jgi:hypothetical protein
MATYTPPPYFPQGQLSPGDPNRYRKFKLIIVAAIVIALLILGGVGIGVFYLIRALS